MTCGKCKGPLSTQDKASYGNRCEDCYMGFYCNSGTGSIPSAVRNAMSTDRHSKTCRNSIRSGG